MLLGGSFGERSLRDPRSLTEDLVEILVASSRRGPCMKIFQMPCPRGTCAKALVRGSWEVLISRSCKTRSNSSRSFHEDLVSFLLGLGMKTLIKVFCKSLCQDLVEVLLNSSPRVPCIKILNMLCIGVFYEPGVLV